MKKILRALIGLALGLSICSSLTAATITWTGASVVDPNDFLNPFNWDLLRIPTPEDDAVIPGGLTNYPTNVEDGAVVRSLLIQSGGSFEFDEGIFTIDATGCNCNALTVENGASLRIGKTLLIHNASGDGIFNQGTISCTGGIGAFGSLLIENVGGVGINNQASGVFTLVERRSPPTRIRNSGGVSVLNNGTFTVEIETWLFADNGISDPGNGFLNQGNLIITGGGNSNIDTNEGIVHYEAGGTFSINTDNGGIISTDPDEIFAAFNTPIIGSFAPNNWNQKEIWSKYRVPLPGEKVTIPTRSTNLALFNGGGSDEVKLPFVSLQSLTIESDRSVEIECLTLDVEELDIRGTLFLGSAGNNSGQLLVKNTFTNSGSLENNGLITNLTGSSLGGSIIGAGSIRTNIADVIWTGAIDSNWDNGDNWDTGTEPGATDEVFIPECTTCPVISSSGNRVNSLVMEGDLSIANSGALEVDGSGLDCWASGIVVAEATLTNDGTLLIRNSQQVGIAGFRCSINNDGDLTIQETFAEGISAYHTCTLSNSSNGVISLSNIGSNGIQMGDRSQLSNNNQITITNVGTNPNGLVFSGFGRGLSIIDYSKVNNAGSIEISNTEDDAVRLEIFSEFINSGTLKNTDINGDGGIETDTGSFTHNTETGIIEVLRCSNDGLEIDEGSEFLNDGRITLDQVGGIGDDNAPEGVEVEEKSIFTNNGTIIISNVKEEFVIADEGAKFFNNGTITANTHTNREGRAIGLEVNQNTLFINRGEISIDQTISQGIEVSEESVLENYGTLNIQNVGTLDNAEQSPDDLMDGIEVSINSSFLNCGELNITGNPEMRNGIWVDDNSSFENTISVTISDATQHGIFVTDNLSNEPEGQNSFTNSFDITVSGSGIEDVRNDNQFDNAECGLIKVEDGFNNGSSGIFNNEGQLVIAGDFTNAGTLNNNGVIADPDGGVATASVSGTILPSEADLPLREVECFRKPDEANGEPEEIPTMGEWTRLIFILFVLSLFIFGVFYIQR